MDDLYRPYRPKRRTRAMIAKEKGLEPSGYADVASAVTKEPLEKLASAYINPREGSERLFRMRWPEQRILLQSRFQMMQLTVVGSAIRL